MGREFFRRLPSGTPILSAQETKKWPHHGQCYQDRQDYEQESFLRAFAPLAHENFHLPSWDKAILGCPN